MELHVPALIPETYLADVQSRLTLYKRIASARSDEALRSLQVEMIDRFGLLPEPTRTLFAVALLKLRADAVGVTRVDVGPRGGRLEFAEDPARYRLQGPARLQLKGDFGEAEARIDAVSELLEHLASPAD